MKITGLNIILNAGNGSKIAAVKPGRMFFRPFSDRVYLSSNERWTSLGLWLSSLQFVGVLACSFQKKSATLIESEQVMW